MEKREVPNERKTKRKAINTDKSATRRYKRNAYGTTTTTKRITRANGTTK